MVKRVAVIGDPVDHSRSPLIHNYWLRAYGLNAHYEKQHVVASSLAQFVLNAQENGFVGFNVTMPHKEAICAHVICDDLASKLQAVNTVYEKDGKFYGTNTDGAGFLAHLEKNLPHWKTALKKICIIGAGGAAKSIIYALAQSGAEEIFVANRNCDRAKQLKQDLGLNLELIPFDQLEKNLSQMDALVQTTSLGMTGQPELALSLAALKPTALVADIVTSPHQTRLLKQADERGHQVLDGLGMLLHQAAPAFAHWFGLSPAVTEALRAHVLSAKE